MAGIDGELLQWCRTQAGWSRSAFAEHHGISLQYLCDIEAGRRSLKRNPSLIGRFAATLNIPRSKLENRGAA